MYLNLHLDLIVALFVGVGTGYLIGRFHAWARRRTITKD